MNLEKDLYKNYNDIYYNMLSEVFWVTFITIVSGLILKMGSYCYKSKCSEVNICCIKIIRSISNEEKLDELELNKIQKMKSNNNMNMNNEI